MRIILAFYEFFLTLYWQNGKTSLPELTFKVFSLFEWRRTLKQSPVFDIFDGPETHRPIFSSPVVNVTLQRMDLCGSGYPEAFSHPVHMANLAESGHTLVGFEGIRLPFDPCVEAEVVGCEVKPGGRKNPPSVVTFRRRNRSKSESRDGPPYLRKYRSPDSGNGQNAGARNQPRFRRGSGRSHQPARKQDGRNRQY
jgi:hypothetical protein